MYWLFVRREVTEKGLWAERHWRLRARTDPELWPAALLSWAGVPTPPSSGQSKGWWSLWATTRLVTNPAPSPSKAQWWQHFQERVGTGLSSGSSHPREPFLSRLLWLCFKRVVRGQCPAMDAMQPDFPFLFFPTRWKGSLFHQPLSRLRVICQHQLPTSLEELLLQTQ